MYYVIFSADPYLLARMATDLQMEGYLLHDWFDRFNPFIAGNKWLVVSQCGIQHYLYFLPHNGSSPDCRFWLTSSNYLRVLGEILNNKTEKI